MKIYLDFDGTVVEHQYPAIGSENPDAIRIINDCLLEGYNVVLNTSRVEFGDGSFESAWQFLVQRINALGSNVDLDSFLSYTRTKLNPKPWNIEESIANQILYIDDISLGIPLRDNIVVPIGKMVDWPALEELFKSHQILKAKT